MHKAQGGINYWMLAVASLVSIGGILYGYDIGVISGALLFIHKSIALSTLEQGLIVGAVLLGGWFGALLAGPVADYAGRRVAIVVAALFFILGVICILLSYNFICLMLARMLLGLGVGVVSVAVPLYVSELVAAASRGRYVTMFQLFLTFGIVLAYFVDLYFTPTGNWRGMFAVVLIPASILLFGAMLLPESPRWLISKGRDLAARKILAYTHTVASIDTALHEMRQSMQQKMPGIGALFAPNIIKITFIAIAIAILNQWTGINAFLQYAPSLLEQAGLSTDHAAMLASAGMGSMNFIVTLVALLLIDKVGRKPLLILGTIGVFVSEIFLAAVSYLHLPLAFSGYATLAGLLAFIIFFAIGPGVVVWLALSELFPTQLRGRGMALCLFFNAMAGWILATMFADMIKYISLAGTYLMCAGASFLYIIIAVYYLPEAKGQTLEELQSDITDPVEKGAAVCEL